MWIWDKCEMMSVRVPSAVVIGIGTLFFLLYILPWQRLPNVPIPSPSSLTPRQSVSSNASFDAYLNYISRSVIASSTMPGLVTFRDIMDAGISFKPNESDVVVILHIQKTGGTSFEKHIVQDLVMEQPCICWKRRKRCKCPRTSKDLRLKAKPESWLFSRFSTGWACGLHADWTKLTTCVDEQLEKMHGSSSRRYFYITMIRDPVHRFLSEFRHVQRGATWKSSRHVCNGRIASQEELGRCYTGENWEHVKLKGFLNCPHNLAFNRQTRMLADLKLVGCYNKSAMPKIDRDRIMLASAKRNLVSMAFVGLTEFQRMSQYIFEETFKLRFKIPFAQNEETYSKAALDQTSDKDLQEIRRLNELDLELYQFAVQLVHSRFRELSRNDDDYEEHYKYIGEQTGYHFSWDEIEKED